jgi:uncharacterized protein (DUF1684 family)
MTELEQFRKMKDEMIKNDPHSPLTEDQKKVFTGLAYYPENPALDLLLELEEFPEKDEIHMQTSTSEVQVYQRFGHIRFEVDGQPAGLTVYKDRHGFFLPFVDSQAGSETYGAGRYLEPEQTPEGKLHVDFNYAYNPYCAYNEYYSCPLTPFENRLKVPVRAGEKLPDGEWVEHYANLD